MISSNMFSSLCEVLGRAVGNVVVVALLIFTPPSNDLLVSSDLSNTLKEGSATGETCISSKAFAVDFRRPNPLGNLGI